MERIKRVSIVGLILLLVLIIGGCGTKTSASNEAVLPITKEQNGIKVTLTKVEQDSDSLKIYVTYTNNSNNQLKQNRAADKVIANGKQYDCDPQFNLDRVEKLNLPHPDWMEPGVSADDVILFSPIKANKVNIALYPNDIRFSFENVPLITK